MKYIYLSVYIIIGSLLLSYETSVAQIDCEDFAVLVTASVDTLTPAITLNWDVNNLATGYYIYRKTITDVTWGNVPIAKLSATTQQYTDQNIENDSAYEYRVYRQTDTGWVESNGYIYASEKLRANEYRGAVILMVDSTYRDSFSTELTRLKFDLIGDGWTVIPHYISPNDSVSKIRAIIKNDYNTRANVQSVFLFGHVPVLYSGNIAPDGHTNHIGAWPADGIYGDMTGVYTDTINYDSKVFYTGGNDTVIVDIANLEAQDTVAVIPANENFAGDGNYDQSLFAGPINLEVGRVDLSNFTVFTLTEAGLLKQYLNKDHAFRQKQFTASRQSVICDDFGVFNTGGDIEAFASCGWRNFAPLLGSTTITSDTANGFFPSLNTKSCLWSYGCGGGDFTGASGIGSTTNFAADTVNTVFTMLFGSYFGDWNVQDNFLRAPLASQPMALSCCWGGRPNWDFHFMGSGETLGFCARWAQNNSGNTYYAGYGANMVHIALMGDPTLTMNIVAPASNPQIQLSDSNKVIALQWSPSPDTIRGYYIYRSSILNAQYTRIASLAANDTSYTDSLPLAGTDYYMVRALKLIGSPSGCYYNLSEGVFDSVTNVVSGIEQWTVNSGQATVYPNPSNGQIHIASTKTIDEVKVTNVLGQLVYEELPKQTQFTFELKDNGVYFLTINSESETTTRKLVVSK